MLIITDDSKIKKMIEASIYTRSTGKVAIKMLLEIGVENMETTIKYEALINLLAELSVEQSKATKKGETVGAEWLQNKLGEKYFMGLIKQLEL